MRKHTSGGNNKMAKEVKFLPGMEIKVTDSAFACTKKRAKIVGRTRLAEHRLRDGQIKVHGVLGDGQIKIYHPDVVGMKDRPVTVHSKYFEPVQASAPA